MKKLKKFISILLIVNMLFIVPTQTFAESIENVESNSQNEVVSQSEQRQDAKDLEMESKASESDISVEENTSQTENSGDVAGDSTSQNEKNTD